MFEQVRRGDRLVTIFLGLVAIGAVLTAFGPHRWDGGSPFGLVFGGLFIGWLAFKNERIGRKRRRADRERLVAEIEAGPIEQ